MSEMHDARPSGLAKPTGKIISHPLPKNVATTRKANRRRLLDKTIDAVHAGTYDEKTGERILRAAGFPDAKNPFAQVESGGVVGAIANLPRGFKTAATPRRKGVLAQQDIERAAAGGVNAGIVAPGTGLLAQFLGPLAQGAVYAPSGGLDFALHPTRTSQQILKHVTHPNVSDVAFLAYIAGVGGATAASRAAAAARAPGLRAAVTRSSEEGGSLLHTPRGEPITIRVPGHGPASGVGPREAPIEIHRPVSRNALVRPVQRARGKLIQRSLDQGAGRAQGLKIGSRRVGAKADTALTRTFSSRTTVGRELRAQARVANAIANADVDALNRAVVGLKRGERAALQAVAISGEEALLAPEVAIARQIATHQHFANLGGDVEANLNHISDLKLALAALKNPSPKLKRALGLAQEVSAQTEGRLVQAGHLTPETAAGRQQKIAELYGYETPPSGSFYFPLHSRYQNTGILPAGPFEAKPSMYGQGPPSVAARVPGVGQTFTGESVAAGRLPDVGEALARRGQQVNNLLAVEKQYNDLYRVGTDVKRSQFDIPIRDTPEIRTQLKQFFADLADKTEASPDEMIALSISEAERLRDLLLAREVGNIAPGSQASRIPGVRWVDSRFIAEMGPSIRGRTFKAADAITNPIRLTQLYARPAYILNLAGNLGMNGISEGTRTFPALKWAVQANKRTPAKVLREADAGMGVSLSRSYAVGTGPIHQANERLAEMWNRITDMHSRRAALRAQAARMGFRSDEDFVRLMTDPKLNAKKIEAFRVANKNIVDYSSLTPFERDEVRRLIYFYPWVSRGTIWALRAMVENPLKSFTLFQLGQVGAENAHKQLGRNLPDWVEQLGLIPVGHSRKGLQPVVNPSSVWTPTTAVQAFSAAIDTGKALLGKPHTQAGLGDLLTPAATLFVQASQRYEGGPTATGLPGLAQSIPYVQAARRAGLWGSPSNTYPEQGIGVALGPLVAGGFYPRGISRAALAKQAVTQAPTPKAKLSVQLEQAAELGLISHEQAQELQGQIPGASAQDVTTLRRQLGPILTQAWEQQAQG